jgi:3-hydroxybutyrate dehydrogenase
VLIWLAALPTLVVFVVNRAIANDGIIINVICAGWVLTPLVQKQIDERAAAEGKTEGGHA